MATPSQLRDIALRLRIHSLEMTTAAGSGHPSSCMSMAEIASVLFFHEMMYCPADRMNLGNDEFVLSKGHAAPILYAAWAEAGILPMKSLNTLRKVKSNLEGHPTPLLPWVKAATGSLGQGICVAVGMAMAMRISGSPGRVYCVLGDGECAEGSVWEAANAAASHRISNLVAIVDVNRLGQNGETMHAHDADAYVKKFKAFGWDAVAVDGHDVEQLMNAFSWARKSNRPVAVIARTIKGKGVGFVEGRKDWHGRALTQQELALALRELGPMPTVASKKLVKTAPKMTAEKVSFKGKLIPDHYIKHAATRDGYGHALVKLGGMNESIVAVDAEVRNSTRAEWFFKEHPDRGFDCYIAESAMAGVAMGMAAKGFIPFAATFSAFLSRAHDFVRMAGLSGLNVKFCGSHSGVSVGEDGPSQMGLEDIAMFRAVPGCIVLYPSDAVSAEKCTELLARARGIGYLRTARMATPILYDANEKFAVGGAKVLRKSGKDKVSVIAAGVTVHEALAAYEELKKKGLLIRVIDAYSVQPLDVKTLREAAKASKGKVIVVEDHYEAGGLGEAVATALSGLATVTHLCVREYPRSGKAEELIEKYEIGKNSIVAAVRNILGIK